MIGRSLGWAAVAVIGLRALPVSAAGDVWRFQAPDGTVHYTNVPSDARYQRLGRLSGTTALPPALNEVTRFFEQRFHRSLPISAAGQSETHDRLGYDHRGAVDVAVHPDSPEGQALIEYLRELGVPFLAYRGAVPGAATGAHIHIGPPSYRIVTPASSR
jgi:hypothetical protein